MVTIKDHDYKVTSFGGYLVTEATLFFAKYASFASFEVFCNNKKPHSLPLGMPFMELKIIARGLRAFVYIQFYYDDKKILAKIINGKHITDKIEIAIYKPEKKSFFGEKTFDFINQRFFPRKMIKKLEKIKKIIKEKSDNKQKFY